MSKPYFPDPRTDCLYDGVIALSFNITTEMLIEAYRKGIFPWPHEEDEVIWFCPDERGVLFFDQLKVSKSLKKAQRNSTFTFTVNKAFDDVIEACAKIPRKGEESTWITKKLKTAYKKFFKAGYVLSVECWEGSQLCGGIYGVLIDNVFSGESMFYKKSNASKLALLRLIKELQSRGIHWMDTQMVTPLTESFGAYTISRDEYLDLLEKSKK